MNSKQTLLMKLLGNRTYGNLLMFLFAGSIFVWIPLLSFSLRDLLKGNYAEGVLWGCAGFFVSWLVYVPLGYAVANFYHWKGSHILMKIGSREFWKACFIFFFGMLVAVVVITYAASHAGADDSVLELRVKKAEYVVGRLYHYGDRRDFKPYCRYLVEQHQKLADKSGEPGYAGAWFYSLVYGAANFGLRCYGTAPGNCAGPLDVKHYPLVLDPKTNIRYHTSEMLQGWKRGYRGRGLCEYVMYPARPHDWGGGRFRKTEATMRLCIERGYKLGKL